MLSASALIIYFNKFKKLNIYKYETLHAQADKYKQKIHAQKIPIKNIYFGTKNPSVNIYKVNKNKLMNIFQKYCIETH